MSALPFFLFPSTTDWLYAAPIWGFLSPGALTFKAVWGPRRAASCALAPALQLIVDSSTRRVPQSKRTRTHAQTMKSSKGKCILRCSDPSILQTLGCTRRVDERFPVAIGISPAHFSLLSSTGVTMAAMETETLPPQPPSVPLELYPVKPFFFPPSSPFLSTPVSAFLWWYRETFYLILMTFSLNLETHVGQCAHAGFFQQKKKERKRKKHCYECCNQNLVCLLCNGPLSSIMNSIIKYSSCCNQTLPAFVYMPTWTTFLQKA